MYSITKIFRFCAAHRLLGHTGKCRHLHGHNYKAVLTFGKPNLDTLGMVTDFQNIKDVIGTWIDANWDHNSILHQEDPLAILHHHPGLKINHVGDMRAEQIFGDREPYLMACNPTAENMAEALFDVCRELLPTVPVMRVHVFETDTCIASYEEEVP